MWQNAWPFRKRFSWTRKRNVYTKELREFSWGNGAGRIGYLNYRDGARRIAVFFELGMWSHDIKLRPPEGPWERDDGQSDPVTQIEVQAILSDITEALTERGYRIGT